MMRHNLLSNVLDATGVGLALLIGNPLSRSFTGCTAGGGLPPGLVGPPARLVGVLTRMTAALLVALISTAGTSYAQQDDGFGDLKPGDKAFAWTQLQGVDDRTHSLADLADQDVVVLCFTSNSCPYSVDYEDRMMALQKSCLDAGQKVVLVAINSNSVKADELDAMKARATEKGFNFAYLKDESQAVAKAYGALYTPEFFVLNKDRTIVFRGAMDDQTDAAKVTTNYVELAIHAALTGKMPSTTEVPARGCAVRYKRVRR